MVFFLEGAVGSDTFQHIPNQILAFTTLFLFPILLQSLKSVKEPRMKAEIQEFHFIHLFLIILAPITQILKILNIIFL